MGLDSWLIGSLLRGAGLEEAGEWADNTVDGAAEAGSYWSEADSIAEVVQDAADHEARQEVHGALQTAKGVADQIPGGELASHAVNIVDNMVGVFDEYVDGPDTSSCGPGGPYISPAVDDLLNSIVGGVADRSKGTKPGAGTKSAVGEGGQLSKSATKAIRSLEKRVAEHEAKRAAYLANPDAYDNLGILRGASPENRAKIIKGRLEKLDSEIAGLRKTLERVRRGDDDH